SVESPEVTGYTPDIETVSGTITADTEVTVTYTADDTKPIDDPTYTVLLTASPANGGNVTGFGKYSENESVTITATAKEGYEFKEWTLDGDVKSTDSTHNFTMPAKDLTLIAVFEEETSGDGGGTTNPPSSKNTYEMSIEKTAVQDEVFVGQDAEFEIVVTNEGNTRLTNITVKDDMTGLNETINLNERQSRTFKVSVKTEEEGTLTNTAEAFHDHASYEKDSASVNVIPVLVDDEGTPESSPDTKDKEPKEEPEKEEIEIKDDPIPKDTPVKEKPETEEIYDETVPLDLPDTGVLPIELFYGLGALVSGAGVLISKKK
ncbi:MAG: InlB B-repeat-containing protein, partial [Bacillota bacterium]|nr:InlB B-repeat-containing protein [Bacillota bacterium]